MRLSPLSQRLRRIARSHAAGETSLADYRHARRQLLAEVVPLPVRKADDTHRRGQVKEGAASKTVEKIGDKVTDITQRSVESARQPQKAPKTPASADSARQRVKRVRHRWMIGALGLFVAALWALLRA